MEEERQDKRREDEREKREDGREREKMKEKMERDRDERKGDFFFEEKKFLNPQTRQMNQLKMFRQKKFPFGPSIPPFFSSKVQNLTMISIIYMIRIRFCGPRELIQRFFSGAQ